MSATRRGSCAVGQVPRLMRSVSSFFYDAARLRFLPSVWRLPTFLMLGIMAGLGLVIIHVSRATSYMSDDPETCANCHVMNTAYLTWQHSNHAEVAVCNDCHVPHSSVAAHWGFKARDGLWHATVFTMRWEPEVIRLSSGAAPVVEENCCRCHARVLSDLDNPCRPRPGARCWDCHRDIPHGEVRSLSTAPDVFRLQLPKSHRPSQAPLVGERPTRVRE